MDNRYKLMLIDKQKKTHDIITTKSLEELDSFTVKFIDKNNIISYLEKIYNENNKKQVKGTDLYLMINGHSLPIMYTEDNFNHKDLMSVYEKYILSHKDLIEEMDEIKYTGKNSDPNLVNDTIYNYTKKGNYIYIPDYLIIDAIDNYIFSEYRKFRSAYFTLKSYNVGVKIDSINKKEDNIDRDEVLSTYDLDDLSNDEIYFDGQGRHR